jgi:hypothetical protein
MDSAGDSRTIAVVVRLSDESALLVTESLRGIGDGLRSPGQPSEVTVLLGPHHQREARNRLVQLRDFWLSRHRTLRGQG